MNLERQVRAQDIDIGNVHRQVLDDAVEVDKGGRKEREKKDQEKEWVEEDNLLKEKEKVPLEIQVQFMIINKWFKKE